MKSASLIYSKSSKGFTTALSAVVLWSFSGILISHPNKNYSVPPFVIAFWSVLFVALGMFVGLTVFSRERFTLDRSNWKFIILYGFTFAVFHSTWTLSVQYNGAAVATFLVYTSPAMTAVLSRMNFMEKFNRIKIISILRFLQSGREHASSRFIDPWTAVFYCFIFATIFLFFFNIAMDRLSGKLLLCDLLWLGNSSIGWLLLFLLGVGPTLGGFGLYTISLRHLTPTVANLIVTLEPAFTTVWAYILLNERLNGIQWAGSILILMGVIFLRWGDD